MTEVKKIGIIGSGIVGQKLGEGFVREGYEVKIGTRDVEKLKDWLLKVGGKGSAGSFVDAAKFGDIVVLATLWQGTENAINMAGKENFKGKIVVDVTNPLDFGSGVPPKFIASPGNSAGEKIQQWLPEAKVVKAFNMISAHSMCSPKKEQGDPDLLIAGNDEEAKKQVMHFAKQFGWQGVHDMGDISQAFLLEALAMIWINYGFKNNHWTHAFKILMK